MTGKELKIKIKDSGVALVKVAEFLGMTPQALESKLKAKNIHPYFEQDVTNTLNKLFKTMHGLGPESARIPDNPDDDNPIPATAQTTVDVPFIDAKVYNDYVKGFKKRSAPRAESIAKMPIRMIQMRYIMVEVPNNDLQPELITGDIVLCVDMIPKIWPALWAADLMYCIVTKQGVLFRCISDYDEENDSIEVFTIDRKVDDTWIKLKDVLKIMRLESLVDRPVNASEVVYEKAEK